MATWNQNQIWQLNKTTKFSLHAFTILQLEEPLLLILQKLKWHRPDNQWKFKKKLSSAPNCNICKYLAWAGAIAFSPVTNGYRPMHRMSSTWGVGSVVDLENSSCFFFLVCFSICSLQDECALCWCPLNTFMHFIDSAICQIGSREAQARVRSSRKCYLKSRAFLECKELKLYPSAKSDGPRNQPAQSSFPAESCLQFISQVQSGAWYNLDKRYTNLL